MVVFMNDNNYCLPGNALSSSHLLLMFLWDSPFLDYIKLTEGYFAYNTRRSMYADHSF